MTASQDGLTRSLPPRTMPLAGYIKAGGRLIQISLVRVTVRFAGHAAARRRWPMPIRRRASQY